MDLIQNGSTNVIADQNKSAQEVIFKAKYRELKKTLKSSAMKNEYLKSELRYGQKKLQLVEEDKSFLLDRLLVYEKPPMSPQPTPDLSDSDPETSTPNKKQKLGTAALHPGKTSSDALL